MIGRQLGIFGMGHIGGALARMAHGLGMLVYCRNRKRLAAAEAWGYSYHENDASFSAAIEFLSLNAPGEADTHHWLNVDRIGRLPHGAIVVNAGKGTLVDNDALIDALRSGQVAGAGLDVYDGEPVVNFGYLQLENVVLLPHLGSATRQARIEMGKGAGRHHSRPRRTRYAVSDRLMRLVRRA